MPRLYLNGRHDSSFEHHEGGCRQDAQHGPDRQVGPEGETWSGRQKTGQTIDTATLQLVPCSNNARMLRFVTTKKCLHFLNAAL